MFAPLLGPSTHRPLPVSVLASARMDVAEAGTDALIAPRFAAVIVSARDAEQSQYADWLSLCATVANGVERIGGDGALLDLGARDTGAAMAMTYALVQRLEQVGLQARVGIGPSLCLAQLAVLTAPEGATLANITSVDAAALLYRAPTAVLTRLRPSGSVTTEDIGRLERFGIRSCGQVARLGELALRRQFGEAKGRFLAAACRGVDLSPLQAAALPEQIHLRLRFPTPLPPARAVAEIADFAQRVADRLAQERRCVRTLQLTGQWRRGVVRREEVRLHEPTANSRVLTQEMARLLVRWLRSESSRRSRAAGRLTELRLTLSDLGPDTPEQMPLWSTPPQSPAERRATLIDLAEALARRYGRPILLTAQLSQPYAALERGRYHLTPLTRETLRAPFSALPHETWEAASPQMRWW